VIPTRPPFWNIENGQLVYLFALVQALALAYGLRHYARRWWSVRSAVRLDLSLARLRFLVEQALQQRRNLRYRVAGIAHLSFSWGFVLLLVGTLVALADEDFGIPIMRGGFYLWFQSLVLDLAGLAAAAGLGVALYKRYVSRPARLRRPADRRSAFFAAFIPASFLSVIATGFLIEGLRIQATRDPWGAWSPVGFAVAWAFRTAGATEPIQLALHAGLWWLHVALASAFIAAIPYSKLMHLLAAPVNLFLVPLSSRNALQPIDFETAPTLGLREPAQLTTKQLVDLDACTECGRCQDACPAYAVGQPLSPKAVIMNLRDYVRHGNVHAPLSTARNGHAEGGGEIPPMIAAVTEDALWSCVTCQACMRECPVFIDHVPTIVDFRRYLVMEAASYPSQLQEAMTNLDARGTPYRGTRFSRTDWCKGLGVKQLAEVGRAEYLYWVGCTSAFDERSQRIARAVATLLLRAGVDFAILGDEETCTGDPARRVGNEYLFGTCARQNVETLTRYGVRKIITACPHCFNTLKNEYPQFEGTFEVLHHSEMIQRLLADGRLRTTTQFDEVVTFHDPCYLGRYNDRYDAPREALQAMPGLQLREMERCRDRSFCCGAGGGHMWLEEVAGGRVNHARTDQALETGARTIATACPFCTVMFEDGIGARSSKVATRVLDVAEVVEQATRPPAAAPANGRDPAGAASP